MKKKVCLHFILVFVLCLNIGCGMGDAGLEKPAKAESDMYAMNTYMTFTAYGDGGEEALEDAKEAVREAERLWSVTDAESELYLANHSGGAQVEVSAKMAEIVRFALEMAEDTGGALEPTIYPLLTAWGFTTDSRQIPAQEEIDRLLEETDYRKIRLEGDFLTVPESMRLDLGAVGKGYASDLAVEKLKEHGVESAVISLGGNIHALGKKPDGSSFRIGVKSPYGDGNLGVLEVSDMAVVTSGGYENYFVGEDGKNYWHILDPADGYPADNGLLSVTVVSPEGKLSDALSTALFVMGTEKAEAYWKERGGFDMILVTDEKEIILTEEIENSFSIEEEQIGEVRVLER